MRITEHPVLGPLSQVPCVEITVDGRVIKARDGEPIAAALLAAGIISMRHTRDSGEHRGVFCGIGQCTDCVMMVDGRPNVRTCVTPVRDGMKINTQHGAGAWNDEN